MTTAQVRKAVENHIDYWKRALHLEHYTLEVKWQSLEEASAETLIDGMYDEATIKFDDERLSKRTSDYIERTVIHELLHIIDRDRDKIIEQLEGSLAPDSWRLFKDVMEQMTEVVIDRVATVMYELDKGK